MHSSSECGAERRGRRPPISSGHRVASSIASSQQSVRPFLRWTPSHASRITEQPAPNQLSPIPRPQSTPQPTAMNNTILPTVVSGQYHSLNSQQLGDDRHYRRICPHFRAILKNGLFFLSTFNSTTVMCGVSDEENIRLHRCLKGKAYEAVKSLLMHPSNVLPVDWYTAIAVRATGVDCIP